MTLEEIDAALAEWQSRLVLATNNLLDLDDLFTYKRLRGDPGAPQTPLTGISAVKVPPALVAINDLWKYLQLLTDVVKRAEELRKSVKRLWVSDSILKEIEQLLTGSSIRLPALQTALAQRGLLSKSQQEQTITPEQLITAMTQTFEEARNTILAVDGAWNRLEPALDAADADAKTLQGLAEALGQGNLPELAAARQKLLEMHAWVESDPLGVDADFDREIKPQLQRVRNLLADINQQRDRVQTDLRRAHDQLAILNGVHADCTTALEKSRATLENTRGLPAPLSQEALADLAQWLDTLDATLQQGRWRPAQVGLERWFKTADSYLIAERAAYAANMAPIEALAELRGRLASLKVKAKAYGARGVILDGALDRIADEAEQQLQQRPTSLERVTTLVTEYETRLAKSLKT